MIGFRGSVWRGEKKDFCVCERALWNYSAAYVVSICGKPHLNETFSLNGNAAFSHCMGSGQDERPWYCLDSVRIEPSNAVKRNNSVFSSA